MSFPQRTLTKSPLDLARIAYQVGRGELERYSSRFSRKDFTQPQLFAVLVLRQFLRADYRGIVKLLSE